MRTGVMVRLIVSGLAQGCVVYRGADLYRDFEWYREQIRLDLDHLLQSHRNTIATNGNLNEQKQNTHKE
jgi:hypothetical protein